MFASGWSGWALIAAVVVALVVLAVTLWAGRARRIGGAPARLLFPVTLLQWAAVALVLLMIWQPALQVTRSEAKDNAVGLLVDNSLSMWMRNDGSRPDAATDSGTPDEDSRLGETLAVFDSTGIEEKLAERFRVSTEVFGDDRSPIEQLDQLPVPSTTTALMPSLEEALQDAREQSLAGLVLITDGSHNSGEIDSDWWQSIASHNIPVFAVAVGDKQLPGDAELSQVDLPDSAVAGSRVPVTVSVSYDLAENSGDASVALRIKSGRNLLVVEDLVLPAGSNQITETIEFTAPDESLLELQVELDTEIQLADGDSVTDVQPSNNVRTRMLALAGQPRRILYIEGEPRWEYKFIRRALTDYPGIDLVSLLRTSPNKLYRQGVSNASELSDGFPITREELFSYDALVIGSLEAAYLSGEQQRFVTDFVRERGGTLLMLAGRNGLGDGGWGRTEVVQALPVTLETGVPSFSRERLQALPTLLGEQTDWLNLPQLEGDTLEAWGGRPELADIQRLGDLKPGASVLLQTNDDSGGRNEPVLAWQRYGRGRSFVLATSGTWRWQMGLPADDRTHESFWQGLMSDLVGGVLPRLSMSLDQVEIFDTSSARLSVDIRDELFAAADVADVNVQLVLPDGSQAPVDLQPDLSIAGRFVSELDVTNAGAYQIVASIDGAPEFDQTMWFTRQDERAEVFGLRRNDELLQQVAQSTGGAVVDLESIESLPDLINSNANLLVRHSQLPLWNMPFFFLIILLCKLIEWGLRWRAGRL